MDQKKEEGCSYFTVNQKTDDNKDITFIEVYKNEESLKKHKATSHFKEIVSKLGELTEKDTIVGMYNLIR